jgi:hypothetical protein
MSEAIKQGWKTELVGVLIEFNNFHTKFARSYKMSFSVWIKACWYLLTFDKTTINVIVHAAKIICTKSHNYNMCVRA